MDMKEVFTTSPDQLYAGCASSNLALSSGKKIVSAIGAHGGGGGGRTADPASSDSKNCGRETAQKNHRTPYEHVLEDDDLYSLRGGVLKHNRGFKARKMVIGSEMDAGEDISMRDDHVSFTTHGMEQATSSYSTTGKHKILKGN